jgi:hypothetical protein
MTIKCDNLLVVSLRLEKQVPPPPSPWRKMREANKEKPEQRQAEWN